MKLEKKKVKVTYGPSLLTRNSAVMIEYEKSIFDGNFNISINELKKIPNLHPKLNNVSRSLGEVRNVHDLLPVLVDTLHDIGSSVESKSGVIELAEDRFILYVEYCFVRRSIFALNAAILIVRAIKTPLEVPPEKLATQIKMFVDNVARLAIGNIVQSIIMKAKEHRIPKYLLLNETVYNSFGQGKNAKIMYSSISEYDSYIGHNLQDSKAMTNETLINIGYPTSEQVMVQTIEQCHQNAQKMGFPVVVKPLSEGQGLGVSANIQTLDQLNEAFIEAEKISARKVLLEKHVEGDVYRITVSKCNIIGLAIRYPAKINGDGVNKVSTLIDQENLRRKEPAMAALKIKHLKFDDRVKRSLNNAGFTLESIPSKGEVVLLSDIANRSVGGTLEML
ncbi:MAG: hypothetical protein P8H03_02755, partial [Emcibacteraceae bacterium]|nr:hypothetical protein [Emcibacteraceae bacterium]